MKLIIASEVTYMYRDKLRADDGAADRTILPQLPELLDTKTLRRSEKVDLRHGPRRQLYLGAEDL